MENQAKKNILRSIPAVDEVLNQPSVQELIVVFSRKSVLTIIRDNLENLREKILAQKTDFSPDRATNLKILVDQIAQETKDAYKMSVKEDFSQDGGGSLPLQALPAWVVTRIPRSFSVAELDKRLRKHHPPLVARINQERLLIDVRTVFAHEMSIISEALGRVA